MKSKTILTEYEDLSAFSGSLAECRHHLLFGRGIRELAEIDGLWIPLTNAEHNMSPYGKTYQIHDNHTAEILSKICGQLAYEKHLIAETHCSEAEAREKFRKRYGQSWL